MTQKAANIKPLGIAKSLLFFGIPALLLFLATHFGVPYLSTVAGIPIVVIYAGILIHGLINGSGFLLVAFGLAA